MPKKPKTETRWLVSYAVHGKISAVPGNIVYKNEPTYQKIVKDIQYSLFDSSFTILAISKVKYETQN